jgi:hypothetical protein
MPRESNGVRLKEVGEEISGRENAVGLNVMSKCKAGIVCKNCNMLREEYR